jgi:general nucleoside transport system ATP-binding protein
VSIRVEPGSFHALLGENGAGKSTLVKCIMGFYHATAGQMLMVGARGGGADPKDAHAMGLGMVYQHFTLVPSLTRGRKPGDQPQGRARHHRLEGGAGGLAEFMDARCRFSVPLDQPVQRLAAGEKQKLEIS